MFRGTSLLNDMFHFQLSKTHLYLHCDCVPNMVVSHYEYHLPDITNTLYQIIETHFGRAYTLIIKNHYTQQYHLVVFVLRYDYHENCI